MKKIILYLIFISLVSAVKAQSIPETPDTVKIIEGAEKLTVSRTGDTTLIEVEKSNEFGKDLFSYKVTVEDADDAESSFDFEIPLGIGKKKEKTSARRSLQTSVFALGNVYIGQRFNYSDKGNVKNSFEGGIRNVLGIRWSHGSYTPSFSIGCGFGYQRYCAQKGFMYDKDGSSLIMIPVGEGCKVRNTDLYVFNFQVPLLFTIPIGCDVEFVVGAVGCFNTYARTRTELDFGNYRTTTISKGLQQRLFTAELTASIGVCDILGVYASWSPMTIFQSPYGPQLKSWSIGATINF